MAMYFQNINVDDVTIGPEEFGNNGGKYRKLSYKNGQLKDVQLGAGLKDLVRCPYGIEPVAQEQPDKYCIKIDANSDLTAFVQALDAKVIEAVNDSSLTHRSTLRIGTISNNMKIKILPDTTILVTTMKNESSMTKPVTGSMQDITYNSMILPIIKIVGGVYFINENYGTSVVASQVLVVKGVNSHTAVDFCLGDGVTMDSD